MSKPLRLFPALLFTLLTLSTRAPAQTQGLAAHLTVYDGGVAEVLEERTVELQPGLNQIEWRSLMPKASARTLRVTAEEAEVARVDVTYDGVLVRDHRSPVLHLLIRNRGSAGARKVQVDYLVPDIDWSGDYALVLDPTPDGAPAAAGSLDSWVSLHNETGTDMRCGTVDLVAGEVSLAGGDRSSQYVFSERGRSYVQASGNLPGSEVTVEALAEAATLGAFSRFRLGRDIALNANAPVSRLPLFQGARIAITQRNVFENEHDAQTLARGGFALVPRGLDVRLISKNPSAMPMPEGQVTIYAHTGPVAQVVGQDRIPLAPPGGEFSVALGRSTTLFGSRRVLERRKVIYKNQNDDPREKLVTRVEVVLANRGAQAAEAIVREGVEPYDNNQWTVIDPSAPAERISANAFQMRVRVPAGGRTVVTYTVETK